MRAGPELVKVRGNVIDDPIADWDGPPGCLRLEGREDVVLRLLENLNAPHFALHAGDSQTRSLTEAQARTGAEGPCYPVAPGIAAWRARTWTGSSGWSTRGVTCGRPMREHGFTGITP